VWPNRRVERFADACLWLCTWSGSIIVKINSARDPALLPDLFNQKQQNFFVRAGF